MKLIMKVDYFDQAWRAAVAGQGLYDEARIESLVRRCADTGFTHIFWRTSVCGRVSYPSKVMTPFQAVYRLEENVLAPCMAKFDPLAVAVEAAHRHGIAIAPWVTTVDSYFPGMEDPFFARNPHLLLTDRANNSVERGVPCYAYPEVQQYRLAEASEVVNEYATDGIYYSSHSHNDCTRCEGDVEGKLAYGYNPPFAEAYKARYGSDPRTEAFDEEKLALLRGEFYLQFLRKAQEIARKRRAWLCFDGWTPSVPEDTNSAGLYAGPRQEYRIALKDLLDVADHINFHNSPDGALLTAPAFAACPANHTYWLEIHVGFSRDAAEKAMAAWQPAVPQAAGFSGLTGFCFHEAMAFEFDCPELWDFAA